MPTQHVQCLRQITEWATPNLSTMRAQFSGGFSIWQCVLQRVVNTWNVRGSSANKWCAYSRQKIVSAIILEFLLTITQNYTALRFCHTFGCYSCTSVDTYTRWNGQIFMPLIMDARSAMLPCYILPMFVFYFLFFLWPPQLAKRLNGSSRNFHTW